MDATGRDELRRLDELRIHLVACFLWVWRRHQANA